MKKINLVLLVLMGWIGVTTSCHKPDFPGNKYCQITTFIDSAPSLAFQYHYLYNEKRLLDSMSVGPTFNPQGASTYKLEYDYLNRPVTIRDKFNFFKYVYQNGRIIRLDELRADNLYHPKYTYKLDWRGRVTERSSDWQIIRWEYEGTSTNFKRRLTFGLADPTTPQLIYEYKYDNKINPWSTWPNTILNPFYFQFLDISQDFEPIPQNNFVHESAKGRIDDGTYFRFRQTYFTYEYDDGYPVKRIIRYLQYNTFNNQVLETAGSSLYYYDCTGKHIKN